MNQVGWWFLRWPYKLLLLVGLSVVLLVRAVNRQGSVHLRLDGLLVGLVVYGGLNELIELLLLVRVMSRMVGLGVII